jgi:hypothetical protein
MTPYFRGGDGGSFWQIIKPHRESLPRFTYATAFKSATVSDNTGILQSCISVPQIAAFTPPARRRIVKMKCASVTGTLCGSPPGPQLHIFRNCISATRANTYAKWKMMKVMAVSVVPPFQILLKLLENVWFPIYYNRTNCCYLLVCEIC